MCSEKKINFLAVKCDRKLVVKYDLRLKIQNSAGRIQVCRAQICGPGSSVGIATHYGLDGLEIEVEAIPTRQQVPSYMQVSGCHRLAAIMKRTFKQSSLPPSPPGTCEFSLNFAFHNFRTPYINPCA